MSFRTMTEFGGIVVTDDAWQEYSIGVATAGGPIRVRFDGDRVDTRIWRDASGTLVCQRQDGPVVPVYSYSAAMADPNTEAASESAVFLQRLVASGLPPELALRLTQQLYRNRAHDRPIPDAIVDRLIAQWRAGRLE